jgi:hypothetical protein
MNVNIEESRSLEDKAEGFGELLLSLSADRDGAANSGIGRELDEACFGGNSGEQPGLAEPADLARK